MEKKSGVRSQESEWEAPHPVPLPIPQMPERGEGGKPGVDTARVASAKSHLERKAKEAGKVAKELSAAAEQLQMEAVNAVPAFEDGLLLDPVQMRKRYTADHAQQNEMRRDACLYMLARNCPVEDIAKILRMNLRTIEALAGLNAEQLASFSQDYADWLNRGSAKAFAHALLKLPEASAAQAAMVGGIMADKAIAVRGGIAQGGEEVTVVELEDPKLTAAREFLKLKSAKPETANLKPEEGQ